MTALNEGIKHTTTLFFKRGNCALTTEGESWYASFSCIYDVWYVLFSLLFIIYCF